MFGKVTRKVGAQRVDHERSAFGCHEQWNMKFIGHFQQAGQGLLSIGHDDGGWLQLDDAMHAALHGVGIRCACQIGNFAFTQYLQAVGMDVVEVVHQIGAGVCRAHG